MRTGWLVAGRHGMDSRGTHARTPVSKKKLQPLLLDLTDLTRVHRGRRGSPCCLSLSAAVEVFAAFPQVGMYEHERRVILTFALVSASLGNKPAI